MDIRVLRYFVMIAQEQSITKAAAQLHTSQSNLSKQMAELEGELGQQLLVRGRRRVTLTEAGMFLRRRATEMIDLMDKTQTDFTNYDADVTGTIRIGAAETRTMRRLAIGMRDLQRHYPAVQFEIFSGSTIEVTDKLNHGLLDFGLLVGPIALDDYDYLKLAAPDRFGLLMRRDHPLAQQAVIQPTDLHDVPLLVARQQLDGNILNGWLNRPLSDLNIVATFNLITTPAMMVEAGLGAAITFKDLVTENEANQLCFREFSPVLDTSLFLVWKKYQIFTRPARLFLDEIRQLLND